MPQDIANKTLSDITVHMKYAKYLPEKERREVLTFQVLRVASQLALLQLMPLWNQERSIGINGIKRICPEMDHYGLP